MNLATKTMKRLGALLLVFAMVVGMLPMQAFADEIMLPLEIKLVRSDRLIDKGSADTDDDDKYEYTYQVVFNEAFPKTGASAKYYWDFDYYNEESDPFLDHVDPADTENHSFDSYTTRDNTKNVAVKVVVDGMTAVALLAYGEGNEGQAYEWEAVTAVPEHIYVGVPFRLPDPVPEKIGKNQGSGMENGTLTYEDTLNGAIERIEEGQFKGYYVINDLEPVSISRKIRAGMAEVPAWRQTEHIVLRAEMPDYQMTYKLGGKTIQPAAGETIWVAKAEPITVCIGASTVDGYITSPEFLPFIEGGSGWKLVNGVYENTINWTGSEPVFIPMGTSTTYDLRSGVQGFTVAQDTTPPTVEVTSAYISGGKTIVKFNVTETESNIVNVTIDNVVVNFKEESGVYTATLNQVAIDFTVGVTNSANLTGSSSGTAVEELAISAIGYEEGCFTEDQRYYKKNASGKVPSITLTITGDTTGAKWSLSDDENKQNVELNGTEITLSASEASKKTLTVTDKYGRKYEHKFDTMTEDKDGPTVTFSEEPSDDETFVTGKTITVTISDDGSGLAENITVSYGEGKNADLNYAKGDKSAIATITLANGETLDTVTVSGAKDVLGNVTADTSKAYNVTVDNEKPVVTANLTGVASIKKVNDDIILVKASTEGEEESTVSLSFTVTDKNLKVDGVKVEGGSKTYDATEGTDGKLTVSFTAEDMASNKTDSVVLTAGDTSVVLRAENGVFNGSFTIENPSENESVPTVTFTDPQDAIELENKKHLFKGETVITVNVIGTYETSVTASSDNLNVSEVVNNQITITAKDNAVFESASEYITLTLSNGNASYSFTHYFAWDNQDPVVTLNVPTANATSDDVNYYQKDVKIGVTVTDLFLSSVKIGTEEYTDVTGGIYETTIEVDENGKDAFSIVATDKATNSKTESVNKIVVDTIDPQIVVTKDGTFSGGYAKGTVTYNVTISDNNLDINNCSVKYNLGSEEKTITNFTKGENEYTAEITVTNGQTLNGYTITAVDKAGRQDKETSTDTFTVDADAPAVSVEPAIANGTSTTTEYIITIDDVSDNKTNSLGKPGSVTSAIYKVTNSEGEEIRPVSFEIKDGIATGKILLNDGDTMTEVKITAKDAADNEATGTKEYTNLTITADTKKPTATLAFSATPGVTLTGFNTIAGTTFLKMENPNDEKKVTITATVTVTDANLDENKLNGTTGEWGGISGNTVTYTQTIEVNAGEIKPFTVKFGVKDAADNALDFKSTDIAALTNGVARLGSQPAESSVTCNDGDVEVNLMIDFRKPTSSETDDQTPNIYVSTQQDYKAELGESEDKYYLYGDIDTLTYSILIRDDTTNENPSAGLESASYTINNDAGVVTGTLSGQLTIQTEGEYKGKVKEDIPISLADETESNNLSLTVTATDNAGNTITGTQKFAVDRKAPDIDVDYGANSPAAHVVTVGENSTTYYAGSRTANITITDINHDVVSLNESTGTKSNWSTSEDGKTKSATVTFDEGVHTLNVTATDKADNVSTPHNESFVIDTTKPTVRIEKRYEGAEITGGTGGKVYHNAPVTYDITITDQYLDNVSGQTPAITISYTLNGENQTVNLTATEVVDSTTKAAKTLYHEVKDGKHVYTYSLPLGDGNTLTNLSVNVTDNAGNITSESQLTDKTVVVDTTSPVLKVEKIGTLIHEAHGHDFYNDNVKFRITVTDTNLDSASSAFKNASTFTINDNSQNVVWTINETGTEMTAEVNVVNEQKLTAIVMQLKDAAGNPAVVETTDVTTSGLVQVDAGDASKWSYKGDPIVVDMTAPSATVTLTSDPANQLVGFYTDAAGVAYLKLATPTTDGSTKNKVKVNLEFAVTDRNLGIGDGLTAGTGSWASSGNGWDGDYLINTDGTAIHTRTVEVETNAVGQIVLDLNVNDLAGNVITTDNITFEAVNNTVPGTGEKSVKADTSGHVTGTITLDRRQVTSGNDTAAPYVELTPSAAAPSATANGLELFNKSFSFSLKVNDGENNTLNSGLKPNGNEGAGSVTWTLTNEGNGNFVTTGDDRDITLNETHKFEETIHINAGSGECNTFKLTVTAVDNVGNTIIYVRNFAVDTLAPRITVEFDNNDVRNDRYFRAERTATVIVDELNFDEAKTDIETQIEHGAWGVDAQGRHVTSIDYNTDGDYTLHVSSTDLAGNHTADGAVNYIGVACQEFTIDLTLPIIEVFYDPEIVSGVDEEGVEYYNADQHIGVRIIEHNFSENDVVDEFYINRDQPLGRGLGEFTDNGDNHNAAILLENGNRYFFRVNYTDLAGNVADGYTSNYFSVDTVPPTIRTISELDNEQMNVVSGDLELQFVINDAQDNLDNVHVVITHTNNSFETVMVSGPEFLTITPQKDRSTVTVNIANIQKLKNLDGIYTIELRAYDYAGNIVTLTPPMVISLNRFGSTFTTDDPFTKQFLTPGSDGVVYHNSVNGNLIIQEINPNRVFHDETLKEEGSVLTIVVNGRSIRLEEGVDYTMTVEKRGQEGSYWYCYTYEIDKKVFEEDGELRNGRYSILIYGVDEAGNNNTNESSEYSTLQPDGNGKYTGKIEFTIDTQAPVIITTGIESNEIYNEEFRQMQIEIADATPTFIQVYLNEELVALSVDATNLPENTLWLTQDKETGIYTLNVNEQSGIFSSQNVRIVATDAAANAAEAEVNDFHISTSFLVRMLNSIWFYVILVAVAAGVVLLIVFSRKKKAAV